ncbi:Gluconate 2-dehydrogenase subunit 3 [Roseovarius tolerans]|uniref:Gluconate 2-dehydrogenase subunit 3 n=1 Tax=Roseovarius tolerans TaxID=74031 RepID=A0A1H7WKY4_9RHOB|nr:gluconate 2-dehydrogenase subunit 3 family protein [Roseovarius tolerans]SEM21679.1 Gluconate 2-dehydrogenase subunit 3 [Roseovarius tolerans]
MNSKRAPDNQSAPLSKSALAVSRRDAILRLASGCLVSLVSSPAVGQTATIERKTLDAVIDTLLPADDLTPSATELGVSDELMLLASKGSSLHRLFALGTTWLDTLDARSFAELPSETRQDVLRYMERADYNEVPGRFFQLLRQMTVEIYYAQPQTYAGLSLNPAPQPEGYPPPWK